MTKKKNSPQTENLPVKQSQEDLLVEFKKAEIGLQIKRHQSIGGLFDKAANVLGEYLDDPSVDLCSKMVPAKIATDIFMMNEKFKREDEKLEIEKRRLVLEELKVKEASKMIGTFNQQNNFYGNEDPEKAKAKLLDVKRKQEELLSSYLQKKPSDQ